MNRKTIRNESLLIAGSITTKLGNKIFDFVANTLIAKLGVVGTRLLAIYQSSEILISVFLNIYGGIKADSLNRRKILIVTDIMSGIVCLSLCFVVQSQNIAFFLIIANIILSLISSFNSPAAKGIIVETIEKDSIPTFNAKLNTCIEIVRIAGPILGMVILKTIGVFGAFLINAISFFISATMEFLLISQAAQKSPTKKRTSFSELMEGIYYVKNNKKLLCILIASAITNFFLAGYNMYLPFTDTYIKSGTYAIFLSFESIGGLVGSAAVLKIKDYTYRGLLKSLGITGASLILLYLTHVASNLTILLYLEIAVFSAFLSIFNVSFNSYVQNNVDQMYIGRVFSIIFSISILLMPIGSAIFSFINFHGMGIFGIIGIGIVLASTTINLVIQRNKT